MTRSDDARLEATRSGVKFDQDLTAAQRRRFLRRDGGLRIRAEGRRGDDVEAHVERVRD